MSKKCQAARCGVSAHTREGEAHGGGHTGQAATMLAWCARCRRALGVLNAKQRGWRRRESARMLKSVPVRLLRFGATSKPRCALLDL
jgi:hypothetical protein